MSAFDDILDFYLATKITPIVSELVDDFIDSVEKQGNKIDPVYTAELVARLEKRRDKEIARLVKRL